MTLDTIITIALVTLTIFTAAVSFLLAKLDLHDKRKKYLGFWAKDLKNYSAYISLVSAILLISLQTKKEINANTEVMNRNRQVDSVERKHFDSTLTAIGSTLALQKITLDSTDSIMRRQIIELENQKLALEANSKIIKGQESEFIQLQKIVVETDAVSDSKLDLYWKIKGDNLTISKFSEVYTKNNTLKDCSIDYGKGSFAIRDTCIKKFPKIVESVNIYFVSDKTKKSEIQRLFFKDTLNSTAIDNDYPPIASKLYFKHFKPDLSLGTTYLNNFSNFYCFGSTMEMSGTYFYKTFIMSKDNKPVPFTDLGKMGAVVVFNSPIKKITVDKIYLNNSKGNKSVIFNLERKIVDRECKSFGETFYQTIYFASIQNGWRTD